MALPKTEEFYDYFLLAIQDGAIHTISEIRDTIAKEMALSDDDINAMIPSGNRRQLENRVSWVKSHLDKAGLVETPSKGKCRITKAGVLALTSGKTVNLEYLYQFDSFREFYSPSDSVDKGLKKADKSESPEERIKNAYKQLNIELEDQLLREVTKLKLNELGTFVDRVLRQAGYKSKMDEIKPGFQKSGTGSIEGVLYEDQLGFSPIYVQVRQGTRSNIIGKNEIQEFVGALQGRQTQKGLLITTSKFTEND